MSNKLNLKTLYIKNFATFENQEVIFENGFNTIVGETGSGKSILLEALQLILGGRAEKKLIRKKSDFALVEASFSVTDIEISNYFDDLGLPYDENIIFKRIIYTTGKSKTFINHQSCTLNLLQKITRRYIDIVGQFDNQKLLSSQYQMKLLDQFSKNNTILQEYQETHHSIIEKEKIIQNIKQQLDEKDARKDFILHQINELNSFSPSLKDEEELIAKKKNLLDFEKNQKSIRDLCFILNEGEHNICSKISLLTKNFDELPLNIKKQFSDKIQESYLVMEDLSYYLSSQLQDNIDQSDLDFTLDRLDQYQKIKSKFGPINDIENIKEKFTKELEQLEQLELEYKKISHSLTKLRTLRKKLAANLHDKRIVSAIKLQKEITKKIHHLNMKGASIKLNLKETDVFNYQGFSSLEFLAETNTGEGFNLIKDTASGGELSRILLALRSIIKNHDTISIFLFDEIDTGVGGETAMLIGQSLSEIAQNSQVIAITHLPQIVHHSNYIISIEKKQIINNNETRTISIVSQNCNKKKILKRMVPVTGD